MRANIFASLCCVGAVALSAPVAKACGQFEDWLTPKEIAALRSGKPFPFRQMERFYFFGLTVVADVDPWVWLFPPAPSSSVELYDVRLAMLAMAQAPFEFATVPLKYDYVETASLDPVVRQARDQGLTRVTMACSGHILVHPTHL